MTEKSFSVYLVAGESVPHFSVSKAENQSWAEVGQFGKKTCWNNRLGWDKCWCEVQWEVRGIDVRVQAWNWGGKSLHANIFGSDIHPALAEVSSELWAKHKYDVGLTKGSELVVITPKSDYRLCQQQYPLKAEAILRITPVFESLLKKGVIRPFDDSPVRTPIFPMKKIWGPAYSETLCPRPTSSKCSSQSKGSFFPKSIHNLVTNSTRCNISFSGRFGQCLW